jgi:anti-sigma B factor antagonist
MAPSDGPTIGGSEGAREHPVAGVDRQGNAVVVRLQGELDLYNAEDVRNALLAACAEEPERLVVDLGEVEFVDSTALGVLVEARTRMADGRALILAAPGMEVSRALGVSGLDRHFTIRDSRDDALAAPL